MTSTPHIAIYTEGDFDSSSFGDAVVRAILIFSKNLDYDKTLARKRVNIHLGDEERLHSNGSTKSIWIKNTIDTTIKISDVDKIEVFLKIIYHSIMTIAEVEGWNTFFFEKAHRLSIADRGDFIWYSPLKTNKSRSLKARIKISLDKEGKVPVVAEFFDNKSNNRFEILIINTFLHFVNWERVFDKPTWLNNEKFGFSLLNSQLLIFANFSLRQSEIIISEKSWSREEIEGRLRQLTYRLFTNDKEFVQWINK